MVISLFPNIVPCPSHVAEQIVSRSSCKDSALCLSNNPEVKDAVGESVPLRFGLDGASGLAEASHGLAC